MTTTDGQNTTTVLATVVAMPAHDGEMHDVELQPSKPRPLAIISSTRVESVDDAGKGLGIAMFVLLLVGFIFNFILPAVSFVCSVATIVIASILTCGCCCAGEYDLKPNVEKFARATLLSLCLMFLVQIVGVVGALVAMGTEASNNGTISKDTANGAGVGVLVALVLGAVLNIMAIVFSGLFTWGRGFGAKTPISTVI
ncbi:hypothetical protein ACHAWF_018494 [Thalassiosira exigua]